MGTPTLNALADLLLARPACAIVGLHRAQTATKARHILALQAAMRAEVPKAQEGYTRAR
jgi:hypothetical protein